MTEHSDYPAIDLGDEEARVAFQITSTTNINKVKDTLQKFVDRELYKEYNRLIIYILTERQKSYSKEACQLIVQDKFDFEPDRDILDFRDILRDIGGFQTSQVHRIQNILEANFEQSKTPLFLQTEDRPADTPQVVTDTDSAPVQRAREQTTSYPQKTPTPPAKMSQEVACIWKVCVFVDENKQIVDKDLHPSNIFIKKSDLAGASKELLECKTGDNWISWEIPEPQYGRGIHQLYIFRTLEGRHGMVVLEYMPIPLDQAKQQEYEIVDRIDVNLLG